MNNINFIDRMTSLLSPIVCSFFMQRAGRNTNTWVLKHEYHTAEFEFSKDWMRGVVRINSRPYYVNLYNMDHITAVYDRLNQLQYRIIWERVNEHYEKWHKANIKSSAQIM